MNDIERRVAELETKLAGETPKYEPGDKVLALVVFKICFGPDDEGDYRVLNLDTDNFTWIKGSAIKGRA